MAQTTNNVTFTKQSATQWIKAGSWANGGIRYATYSGRYLRKTENEKRKNLHPVITSNYLNIGASDLQLE